MDEGSGDEVTPLNVPEGAHFHSKENEHSLKPPETSDLLESHQMIIPAEGAYSGSSFHVVADILDTKGVIRNANSENVSEHPRGSPRYLDDVGNIVEELTVHNYDSSNLPIVGTSNNWQKVQNRQSQWQHLYQLGVASGTGSSRSKALNRENVQGMSSVREDVNYLSSHGFLGHSRSSSGGNEVMEQSADAERKEVSRNMFAHTSIRTKILSRSGFSEFFIKNTVMGKGIIFRGPAHEGAKVLHKDDNNGKAASVTLGTSNSSLASGVKTAAPSFVGIPGPKPPSSNHDAVSLRHWLNAQKHKVNKVEALHMFRQIVNLIDCYHSQGVVLHDLKPSSFRLRRSNQVKYVGSTIRRDMLESATDQEKICSENQMVRRRLAEKGTLPFVGAYAKKQKLSENTIFVKQRPQLPAKYAFNCETATDGTQDYVNRFTPVELNPSLEYGIQGQSSHQQSKRVQQLLTSVSVRLEEKWYASPEELNEGICTISSNIYSLGVLLFELLGHFDSERGHATAMSELRDRILPPQFLSENSKEAGFCLWLLHPAPSSRPTTREILQCELINGLQKVSAEELSSSIDQDDAESELLLHFLVSLNEHKQKDASKLANDIKCIEADVEEVERRYRSKNILGTQLSQFYESKEMRLKSNFSQLESAYFSMRSKIQHPEIDAIPYEDNDLLRGREHCYSALVGEEKQNPTDCLGSFFDGLCKYARYSKFEVRGLLRTGDFNNSANVICSLSFDRDLDYFATAGVSKKIRIFEFKALLNDSFDIHHPVIELANKSKLSCVCWNNYIKNYLASTDYDGVVKLWDASTGQDIFQYSEHERRAWSVDFSQVYPTKFASGSDDCSVKLWSINEKKSLGTIRNIANVCCVQFSSHSTHMLAFGSANCRSYCYDLRNLRTPWCVLAGHEKTVSYVKFLDPETLVTASIDNSLKVWDLTKASSSGLSTSACSLTLGSHTNEKNFVGLSVSDGYIACGSETNEVYAYYRSLPMPITSHKFGSIDPISGKETDDDGGQFVSSVCWRGNSDMVVAASSTGCIKVLQMV